MKDTNSLNRDGERKEVGERFSTAGMRASARIVRLKRLDRTVIEKIVAEEINSELEKVRQETIKECIEALPKKRSCKRCDNGEWCDCSTGAVNSAIDQATKALLAKDNK